MIAKYLSPPQSVCFGGDTDESTDEKMFSQGQVDRLMIGHRRKLQEDLASAQARLKLFESRPDMDSALSQRDGEWQSRVHELEDTHAKLISDALTAKEQELATRLSERDAAHVASLADWQGRHGEVESKLKALESRHNAHLATVELTNAAAEGQAVNPRIVTRLLSDRTTVQDGCVVVDVGGKLVSPSEAVDWMRGQVDEFGSLFKSNSVGGISGSSGSRLKQGSLNIKNMSPEQYREMKRTNPSMLGFGGGQ